MHLVFLFGFQYSKAAPEALKQLSQGVHGHPMGLPSPHALGWSFASLSFWGKVRQVSLYSFGETETDHKDQDFLARARSLLRDSRDWQECGRGLGPDWRVRPLVGKMDG